MRSGPVGAQGTAFPRSWRSAGAGGRGFRRSWRLGAGDANITSISRSPPHALRLGGVRQEDKTAPTTWNFSPAGGMLLEIKTERP